MWSFIHLGGTLIDLMYHVDAAYVISCKRRKVMWVRSSLDFFGFSKTRTSMNDITHSLQGATLFLILSHPDVYRYVSRLTRYPVGSFALAALHAIVFFLVTYVITKLTRKPAAAKDSSSGVVSNSWWFKP
jgi:hypothetical protein